MSDTATVELTLNEAGFLCHLMMADPVFRRFVMSGSVEKPAKNAILDYAALKKLLERRVALYTKLAAANDTLMHG